MRMSERLYLTEDRSKAVREEDRRGRHLLCKKGSEIDDETARRYGIIAGYLIPEKFSRFTARQLEHLAEKYGIETLKGISEEELIDLLVEAEVPTDFVSPEVKARARAKAKQKKAMDKLKKENFRLSAEIEELRIERDELIVQIKNMETEAGVEPKAEDGAKADIEKIEGETGSGQIIPPEVRRSGKVFKRGRS